MNFKKYLDKQMIKTFLKNFGFMFVGVSSVFTLLMYSFNGELPKDYMGWVVLIGILSLYYGIGEIKTNKKIEETDQLTRDNYWKLKNELKKKVNRRK